MPVDFRITFSKQYIRRQQESAYQSHRHRLASIRPALVSLNTLPSLVLTQRMHSLSRSFNSHEQARVLFQSNRKIQRRIRSDSSSMPQRTADYSRRQIALRQGIRKTKQKGKQLLNLTLSSKLARCSPTFARPEFKRFGSRAGQYSQLISQRMRIKRQGGRQTSFKAASQPVQLCQAAPLSQEYYIVELRLLRKDFRFKRFSQQLLRLQLEISSGPERAARRPTVIKTSVMSGGVTQGLTHYKKVKDSPELQRISSRLYKEEELAGPLFQFRGGTTGGEPRLRLRIYGQSPWQQHLVGQILLGQGERVHSECLNGAGKVLGLLHYNCTVRKQNKALVTPLQ